MSTGKLKTTAGAAQAKAAAFSQSLDQLEQALPTAKDIHQAQVFETAAEIIDNQDDGLEILYGLADRFEQAGVFAGGPWDEPAKLQPRLVSGSLMAEDITPIVEILSELRMVSLAKENYASQQISAPMAEKFLHEVMALNLDLLFPEETEAARIEGRGRQKDRAERVFKFLADQMSLAAISGTLVKEIDCIMAQRPIMVKRALTMIQKADHLLEMDIAESDRQTLETFIEASHCPTERCKQHTDYIAYRSHLKELSAKELTKEARQFAEMMRETGLVAPYHVILVRHLNRSKPQVLPEALDLSRKGKAHLEEHFQIVSQLINVALHPSTRQSLYGLARILERGVLSSPPVVPGLRRLIELDLQADVRNFLLKHANHGLTANDIMIAGVISVLGQPLGIGQGMNPTCQTARGISLWSLHAQGYLLEIIARAARDGDVDIMFEGQPIHSKDLQEGLAADLDEQLDPVSLILVPHLDRIYGELCRRAAARGEDVHKWVNPAFYGDWVSRGFSSCIDALTHGVTDYPGFVRLFYATHHPEYNEGYELIYPNPVGIIVTNAFGKMLGLHAVSIQRIAKDPDETYRVYFYNPNNDGAQDWGQGVEPKVKGHGEEPGESSLPFPEFLSRLYAFHYNPYEQGDAYAVNEEMVDQVQSLAKDSWGQEYTWLT